MNKLNPKIVINESLLFDKIYLIRRALMRQEIEIEFKVLLTKKEYHSLLQLLPFPKDAITQTNYYFETDLFLFKEKNAALRIRKKNDSYTLTLKQPHEQGILETHETLTENEAMQWIKSKPVLNNKMIHYLNLLKIPIHDLKLFGSLSTERRQFERNDIVYVLDKSFYNNYIDYELEIESPSKKTGLHAFHALLDEFNIKQKESTPKIERFFKTLSL